MQVAIRVDASLSIGTGHVMRCLTLAQALRQNRHNVFFICRELPGNLIDTIQQQGFAVYTLEQQGDSARDSRLPHADWLPVSQLDDACETQHCLDQAGHVDWLVVDHYALDQEWQQHVKPLVKHLLVIDDLADRQHLADILLDQNYYPDFQKRYDGLIPANCIKLLGPDWVLLREEFTTLRNQVQARNGDINKLIVFFGGADNSTLAMHTLQAIESTGTPFQVSFIVPESHPDRPSLLSRIENNPNIQIHTHVQNMAQRMLQADLAIGAGGTTTWERCYLGLPSIVFTLAHNQAAVNRAVSDYGACLLAGDIHAEADDIATAIQSLLDEPDKLKSMSQAALRLMQNHIGAAGVVSQMEQLHV